MALGSIERERGPLRDGPFFPYFGAKWQSTPHYPQPRYELVIEPFAGSACYATRVRAKRALLCDIAAPVAGAWRYLLSTTSEDVLALPDVEKGKDVRLLEGVSRDCADLIGWWISGALPKIKYVASAWVLRQIEGIPWEGAREGATGGGGVPVWGARARGRIARQLPWLSNWTFVQKDYRTLPNVEATWFVDPPYKVQGKAYHGSSLDIDYDDLAEWCKSRKGQVIVCEQEGVDWLPFRSFRAIRASRGRKSREVIWTNA